MCKFLIGRELANHVIAILPRFRIMLHRFTVALFLNTVFARVETRPGEAQLRTSHWNKACFLLLFHIHTIHLLLLLVNLRFTAIFRLLLSISSYRTIDFSRNFWAEIRDFGFRVFAFLLLIFCDLHRKCLGRFFSSCCWFLFFPWLVGLHF